MAAFDPLRSSAKPCGSLSEPWYLTMRRPLSEEDREIRSGRGHPLPRVYRLWPIPLIFLASCVIALDDLVIQQCVGRDVGEWRNHGRGSWVRLFLAFPCSPYYPRGTLAEWMTLATLWVPLPFAAREGVFYWRRRKYWGRISEREKLRRSEKRAAKKAEGKQRL